MPKLIIHKVPSANFVMTEVLPHAQKYKSATQHGYIIALKPGPKNHLGITNKNYPRRYGRDNR